MYTPLDLAEKRKHQVVVDYLRSRRALRSSEVDEGTKKNSRTTFEERMVAGDKGVLKALKNEFQLNWIR